MANLTLPDLDLQKADLGDAKQVKRLKDYIYTLTEQLRYVLSNLDAENLAPELSQGFSAATRAAKEISQVVGGQEEGIARLGARVESCQSQVTQFSDRIDLKVAKADFSSALPLYSAADPSEGWTAEEKESQAGFLWYDPACDAIKQWDGSGWLTALDNTWAQRAYARIQLGAEAITQKVARDGVISAINQSPEEIAISAGKIALEGAVTVNGSFTIDEDGYLACTGGTIGDFTVDSAGGLMGNGVLKVGGMTLSGNRIGGLKATGENLDWAAASDGMSLALLGMDANGNLYACALGVIDGNGNPVSAYDIEVYNPYSGAPTPAGGVANVIQITARGDGLTKRAAMSTGAAALGTCAANDVYSADSAATDASGYLWTYCTRQYAYSQSLGKWVPSPVTPFYVRKYSDGNAHKYYDSTTVNT